MKYKKLLLTGMVLLSSCGLLAGCHKNDVEKVSVCSSSQKNNVRYKYEFKYKGDGPALDEIKFIQTITEDAIKEYHPDKDLEKTYDLFKDDMKYQYDTYTDGNEGLVWFKAKFEEIPEKHYAKLTFVFDVDNKNLDMKDKDTRAFLEQFWIHKFYNNDEKAFLFDEKKGYENTPLVGIDKVQCKTTEVKKEK